MVVLDQDQQCRCLRRLQFPPVVWPNVPVVVVPPEDEPPVTVPSAAFWRLLRFLCSFQCGRVFAGCGWIYQEQCVIELHISFADVESGVLVTFLAVGCTKEVRRSSTILMAWVSESRFLSLGRYKYRSVSSQNAIAPAAALPSFQ